MVAAIFYRCGQDTLTHYRPGDGNDSYADPIGPSATAALLDFFSRQDL